MRKDYQFLQCLVKERKEKGFQLIRKTSFRFWLCREFDVGKFNHSPVCALSGETEQIKIMYIRLKGPEKKILLSHIGCSLVADCLLHLERDRDIKILVDTMILETHNE